MFACLFTPAVVRQARGRCLTNIEHLFHLWSRVETCVLGILIATNTPPPSFYPSDVVAFAQARYSHLHKISVPDSPRRYEELRTLSHALRTQIDTSLQELMALRGFAPGWRRRAAETAGDGGPWRVLRAWSEEGEKVTEITGILWDGRRVVEEMEAVLGVPEEERETHPSFCVTWGEEC